MMSCFEDEKDEDDYDGEYFSDEDYDDHYNDSFTANITKKCWKEDEKETKQNHDSISYNDNNSNDIPLMCQNDRTDVWEVSSVHREIKHQSIIGINHFFSFPGHQKELPSTTTPRSKTATTSRTPTTAASSQTVTTIYDKPTTNTLASIQMLTKTPMRLPIPSSPKKNNNDNNKTVIQLPAQLKVITRSVSKKMLSLCYGSYYAEGQSFPRKFAVSYSNGESSQNKDNNSNSYKTDNTKNNSSSISSSNRNNNNNNGNSNNKNPWFSILLIRVLPPSLCDASMKNDDDDKLTTTIMVEGYGVEELTLPTQAKDGRQRDCYDFRDIVEPIIVLDSCSSENINNNRNFSTTKCTTFKSRHMLNFESSNAIFTETKYMTFDDVFGGCRTNNNISKYYDITTKQPTCGVCYETMDIKSFTTLTQCGHTFCNQCFEKYIEVELTKPRLHCMEYKCETIINATTILSFMEPSSKSLRRYTWKGLDHFIMKEDGEGGAEWTVKECPTPGCHSIAMKDTTKVESYWNTTLIGKKMRKQGLAPKAKKSVNVDDMESDDQETTSSKDDFCKKDDLQVRCRFCNLKWCFECLQPKHWPLSCDAAQTYKEWQQTDSSISGEEANLVIKDKESLYQPYDYRILKRVLKRCPRCKVVMEKTRPYGCSWTFCLCRRGFMWYNVGRLTKVYILRWLIPSKSIRSLRTVHLCNISARHAIIQAFDKGKQLQSRNDGDRVTSFDKSTHYQDIPKFLAKDAKQDNRDDKEDEIVTVLLRDLLLEINDCLGALNALTKISQFRHKRRVYSICAKSIMSKTTEGKTLLATPSSKLKKKSIGILRRQILKDVDEIITNNFCIE